MAPIHRTLRFKIAGAFLVWTILFQVAMTVTIPVVRDRYVIREVDREIRARIRTIARDLIEGEDPVEAVDAGFPALPGDALGSATVLYLVIMSADGHVIAATPGLEGLTFPAAPLAPNSPAMSMIIPEASDEQSRQRMAAIGRLRIATLRIEPAIGATSVVHVAYSMRSSDWIRSILITLLGAALIPGILGAAAAGWIVAGRMAGRIERVGRKLRAVSAARLGERVEVSGGEDEIGALAADINAMLERLAATFQGMEQFMSEVSHELKTPVAALLAEAQVMKFAPQTPETSAAFVASVEEEMRRLGKLIESFLMLARFEHGRRFFAEGVVSVNDIVLNSVEHSTRMADQAGVTLALTLYDAGQNDPEATVRGDGELLRVVVDNLIRNAVQFSDRGSTVAITVEQQATAGKSEVVISVRDRGPGAPPDYINKIFERFVQAPSQKVTNRGTGLGLSIAKGVVELHGGTIHALNHPDGGCVFSVRLPQLHVDAPRRVPRGSQAG